MVNRDRPAHAKGGQPVGAGDQHVQQLGIQRSVDVHFADATEVRDGLIHGGYLQQNNSAVHMVYRHSIYGALSDV